MPKRISKNQRVLANEYFHGLQIGKSFTFLAIELQLLRSKKKLTVEQVSESSGVSAEVIIALEGCDLSKADKIYIEDLVALVRFYDVGAVVKFVALASGLYKEEDYLNEMQELVESLDDFVEDTETISKTEHYRILAEKDLEIFQLQQRLNNANQMNKSYVDEFQKHGLAYKQNG